MGDDDTETTATAATAAGAAATPKAAAADPTAELTQARRQLKQFQDQVNTLNGQLAGLPTLQAQVRDLQGVIRSGKYKSRLAELGTDLRPGALELIFDKLGIDTSADEPDDDALGTALATARTKFALAFEAPATSGADKGKTPVQAPPATAGRGGPARDPKGTKFVCKKSDHRDPKWVRENAAAIREARKNGTYQETND